MSEQAPKDGRARNIPNGGMGRPKGTPNKATSKTREAIALVAEAMAPEFMGWLQRTADGDMDQGIKPDPKGAADIYLKAIEYHIPKLSRVEGHVTQGVEMSHEQWLDSLTTGDSYERTRLQVHSVQLSRARREGLR